MNRKRLVVGAAASFGVIVLLAICFGIYHLATEHFALTKTVQQEIAKGKCSDTSLTLIQKQQNKATGALFRHNDAGKLLESLGQCYLYRSDYKNALKVFEQSHSQYQKAHNKLASTRSQQQIDGVNLLQSLMSGSGKQVVPDSQLGGN